MKKLFFLFLLVSPWLVFSQNRPLVVNNHYLFPPLREQWAVPNCTHFSLIYYLKSSLWNRQFNRDPGLPENQFNNNFVWNQNIHPLRENSSTEAAFYFMKHQGCATALDFPFNELSNKIKPDLATRQKALQYKSKGFRQYKFWFFLAEEYEQALEELKDSLARGTCFTLEFPILDSFWELTDENRLYDCDTFLLPGTPDWGRHSIVVIGYNDTIKTALNRGAFMLKDSNRRLADGILYMSYSWFRLRGSSLDIAFLEEDFTLPARELVLNLKLSGGINGSDCFDGKKSFVDTVTHSLFASEELSINCRWDHDYLDSIKKHPQRRDFFSHNSYLYNRNQVQLYSINGKRLPLRKEAIFMPYNSKDGYYELVTDLTEMVSLSDFQSLSLMVFDPLAASYITPGGLVAQEYSREPSARVEDAYITVFGTDKTIKGRVVDLPDTTIVEHDFYAQRAGLPTMSCWNLLVKTGTSVLARKLITFSIDDLISKSESLPASQLAFRVYPNPAQDKVNLSFELSQPEMVNLSLYDVSGRFLSLLAKQNLLAGRQELTAEISNLVAGVYIVHLKTESGRSQAVKIIKR